MKKLTVSHYLAIYQIRKNMFDQGVTNPPEYAKTFICNFIRILEKMPPDAEIKIRGKQFTDAKGTVIATFPNITD